MSTEFANAKVAEIEGARGPQAHRGVGGESDRQPAAELQASMEARDVNATERAMARLYSRSTRRAGGRSDAPLTKSEQMARVRKTDTAPEMVLRRALWAAGLRYRVVSDLRGRPDIVFPGPKVAIFVDGCFWHSCPEHGTVPSRNRDYWEPKLARNRARDASTDEALRAAGWVALRFWEHEIASDCGAVLETIKHALTR